MSPAAGKTAAINTKTMGGKEFEETFRPKGGNIVSGKLANEKTVVKKKRKKSVFIKILIILLALIVLLGGSVAALYFSGNLTAVFNLVGLQLPSGPSIAERQAALDHREAELKAFEQSLNELAEELDARQAALEAAENTPPVTETTFEEIRAAFSDEKLSELQQLGVIYSKMDPAAAAAIMTEIYDADQIAVIVYNMKPAAAALVLEKLAPALAADVTEILAN